MSAFELDPWMVAIDTGDRLSAALWMLEQTQAVSLAVFSSQEAANRYASDHVSGSARAWRPARHELVQVMIDCYRQGILYAALDPDGATAKRVFELRAVLSAAKKELKIEAL